MMLLVGTGRFVKAPELVTVGNTVKAVFTLVYNEVYNNKTTGERIAQPHYFDFEAWDSAAKFLSENCQQGDKMAFQAIPRQEKWEKDGQKRQRTIFRVTKFETFTYGENE